MTRSLFWLGVLLMTSTAAAAPAPDKENTPFRPVLLPLGVADPAGRIGFVANDKDGIDAIDLATGDTLWQTKESTKPLLAFEKRLVVWAAVKDKPHDVRVLVLDTTDKGKKVLESEPIALPDWAVVSAPYGHTFTARAHLEKGAVVFGWEAHAFYAGGAAPTPAVLKAAKKDAAGSARVSLDTGKVEVLDPKKPDDAGPALPESLAKVKSRQYWTGSDWKTTPLVVGDKASALQGETNKDQEKLSLKIFDLASGKEKETVPLLQGKSLWPQRSLDGRHVVVNQALPKEQLPEGDYAFWIYELDTGKQVAKLPYQQTAGVSVVGGHAFFLLASPRKGPIQPRVLQAVDLKTGKVVWEHAVEPIHNVPPPP